MSLEVLVLGLFSGLRPSTSLAAVLAVLKTARPRGPLLVFCIAGFASVWLIGMLVVRLVHGANTAIGGSTLTAVVDLVLGVAALAAAVAAHRGWSPQAHRRDSNKSGAGLAARLGESLREPSARAAAAAGIATHIPGLFYLVALNSIASSKPDFADAAAQVAIYDALWFLIPFASLALVILRPGAALRYLDAATAWLRRHDQAVLFWGLLLLGAYLAVKGTVKLLT